MNDERKQSVTIEDLLRLKRAERPPAAFWERFDRELRAKQLSALVEKLPWWQAMPRYFSSWRRYHLHLGTTAVLAVTFISLREYSDVNPARATVVLQAEPAAEAHFDTRDVLMAAIAVNPQPSVATESAALQLEGEVVLNESSPRGAFTAGARASELTLLSGAGWRDERAAEELSPPARYGAANFAAGGPADSVISRGLLGSAGADVRPASSRNAPVEPLAQMTHPGEARRSRILSAITIAASAELATRAGERVARNLSDDRMNDSIRRFNAKGDRLSVKF